MPTGVEEFLAAFAAAVAAAGPISSHEWSRQRYGATSRRVLRIFQRRYVYRICAF